MRTFLIAMLVLGLGTASAQQMIDREVGNFHEIKVFDLIEVNMIRSDENRIVIKGDRAGDIEFVNRDGVLKLRMEFDKKFRGEAR